MRKVLGGGMRQAGVIAAPGIVALTKMVDRLSEDHANARLLGERLSKVPGISVDLREVETNMVVVRLPSVAVATAVSEALAREGVLVSDFGGGRLRLVTHYGIDHVACERAADIFARVAASRV
jgi:threonine aldolase